MLKSCIYTCSDIVDTAFSYERELIVCSFLPDFSMGKGSSFQLMCNAHTAFLLCRQTFPCVLIPVDTIPSIYNSVISKLKFSQSVSSFMFQQKNHVFLLVQKPNIIYYTTTKNEYVFAKKMNRKLLLI